VQHCPSCGGGGLKIIAAIAASGLFRGLSEVEDSVVEAAAQARARELTKQPPRLRQPNRKQIELWASDYMSFKRWGAAGTFETMHDRLRQQWRERIGKAPEPTAAIIDSQSTRSTAQGGNTGFDAGKKIKGRKRNLVVDTLGLLLAVTVTAASVQDRDTAADVVAKACTKVPGLKRLYADGAYGGRCALAIEKTHGITVEVVRHPGNRSTGTWQDAKQPLWPEEVAKGFVVQAKRWVVERTHAWNERSRRLIAHHDRSDWAPVAWVWLAEARILATRLAR